MVKNLVYACVFANKDYLQLTKLLLQSIHLFSDVHRQFDILILTHYSFMNILQEYIQEYALNVLLHTIDLNTLLESKCARLSIFELPFINNYEKVLYLDTDIIIIGSLDTIFQNQLQDKLYAVPECDINSDYFGKFLFNFNTINPKTPAFNSGVLLFRNCQAIKDLFSKIHLHIKDYYNTNKIGSVIDQPFFNYHAITSGLHDLELLSTWSTNDPWSYQIKPKVVVCHFPGNYSTIENKATVMKNFLNKVWSLKKA
jgi:lipopolysaccharide biosynthesis glycosyltransferase